MIPSLQGLGLALPEGHATQASALALARRMWPYPESIDRVLEALYRRTGVATRNTILDLEDANPLVLGASQLRDRTASLARVSIMPVAMAAFTAGTTHHTAERPGSFTLY